MSVVTRAAAKARAVAIRDATADDSVTPTMVGGLLEDAIDSVQFDAAAGDVVGPAGGTAANELVVFSSGTGKAITGSGTNVAAVLAAADAAADAGDAAVTALIPAAGGAPANVTKAAAAAGVATTWSRSDHKHDITTAATGAFSVAGEAAAEGTATSLARSDHKHSLTGKLPWASVADAALGQMMYFNGTIWTPIGPATRATALADADVSVAVSEGNQAFLLAATLSASRTFTFSTSTAVLDDIFTIYRLDTTANTYVVKNAAASTIYTFAASTKAQATFRYDGSDWVKIGQQKLTS